MLMKHQQHPFKQQGSVLLEALISILIFSIGILGLVAMQAAAIKNSIDAKYRSDASYLANQIISQMWVDRANIDSYAHYPTGTPCTFSGSASSNARVTSWAAQAVALLPGAASNKTQIEVTTPVSTPDTRQVKVTVCWKSPQETVTHNFVATAHINQ